MKKLLIVPFFALAACGSDSADEFVAHYGDVTATTTLLKSGTVSVTPVGNPGDTVTPTTSGPTLTTTTDTSTRTYFDDNTSSSDHSEFEIATVTVLERNQVEVAMMEFYRTQRLAVYWAHCPWGETALEVEVEVDDMESLQLDELNQYAYDKFLTVADQLGHDLDE